MKDIGIVFDGRRVNSLNDEECFDEAISHIYSTCVDENIFSTAHFQISPRTGTPSSSSGRRQRCTYNSDITFYGVCRESASFKFRRILTHKRSPNF